MQQFYLILAVLLVVSLGILEVTLVPDLRAIGRPTADVIVEEPSTGFDGMR
jgi:hypothetical protein